MTDLAIRVEHLSKKYRIGQYVGSGSQYRTLRESLTNAVSAPLRRLRQTGDGRRKTGPPSPASRPRSSVAGQPSTDGFIWALRDVSFEVKRGEVLGIIGRNGAGKSTLLKILTRITEPTKGRAELHGRVGSLLEVGTGFHPELTGRENIYLSGAILGMTRKEIDRKFDEIVDFSGVETYIDTPVKRYSSGMRVRLGFAVAAYLEPEILLVDEVLAVGDYEFQKKCLGKMGEVSQEGRTVLLVSHNMLSIVNLCRRAILLDAGKVVTDGQAAEVIQHYLATARSAGGEVVWPDPATAPGNEKVRLHAVQILSEDGELASELDLSKDIIIRVNYWCMKDGARLIPSVVIVNQMNVEILENNPVTGIYADLDKPCNFLHKVGLYQVEFQLPSNLLNEGTYSVEFGFFGVGVLTKKNEVSFRVHDSGSNPKPDGHPWRGVIRARLVWSTKYLGLDSATNVARDGANPAKLGDH